ncbi:hypothetical protein J6590_096274 [Homalodisca vitripennis]|nr:hypothetical protein J6590_096274 [Homalodisca vitripennis]
MPWARRKLPNLVAFDCHTPQEASHHVGLYLPAIPSLDTPRTDVSLKVQRKPYGCPAAKLKTNPEILGSKGRSKGTGSSEGNDCSS